MSKQKKIKVRPPTMEECGGNCLWLHKGAWDKLKSLHDASAIAVYMALVLLQNKYQGKNRHGLEEKLSLDFSEIEHLFAKISTTHGSSDPVAEKLPKNISCIDPSTTPEKITSEVKKSAPIVSETVDFNLESEWGVTLAKLMGKDNVSSMQIRQVVAKRGHYLVGTKISSYDDEFVTGVLIPGWDQVVGMIKEMKLESIN
jgi:hypothetical protein